MKGHHTITTEHATQHVRNVGRRGGSVLIVVVWIATTVFGAIPKLARKAILKEAVFNGVNGVFENISLKKKNFFLLLCRWFETTNTFWFNFYFKFIIIKTISPLIPI